VGPVEPRGWRVFRRQSEAGRPTQEVRLSPVLFTDLPEAVPDVPRRPVQTPRADAADDVLAQGQRRRNPLLFPRVTTETAADQPDPVVSENVGLECGGHLRTVFETESSGIASRKIILIVVRKPVKTKTVGRLRLCHLHPY
jgi:hypothetical protein